METQTITQKYKLSFTEAEEIVIETGKIQLDFVSKNWDKLHKDTASYMIATMDGDKVRIFTEWLKEKWPETTEIASVVFTSNLIAATSGERPKVETILYEWFKKA